MSAPVSEVELPDMAAEPRKTFSGWRVACSVVLAMLLVVPALVYLELKDQSVLGRDGNRALAQRGAGRRLQAAFDLSATSVPQEQILSGGPPKDGIPALLQPQFVAGSRATYLAPEDRVIGVVHGDEASGTCRRAALCNTWRAQYQQARAHGSD